MDLPKLVPVCRLMFGTHWQTATAKLLKYSAWTVNRWALGISCPPPEIYPQLIEEINAHILQLVEQRDLLRRQLQINKDPDLFLRNDIKRREKK